MKRFLLPLLAALVLLAGCTGTNWSHYSNHQADATATASLGAQLVRVEFPIGTSCATMEPVLDDAAGAGAQAMLLVGFDAIPSQAQAQSVAAWWSCFGEGSAWCASQPSTTLCVHSMEFGNESSYCYNFQIGGQSACNTPTWYSNQVYLDRACAYGDRVEDAHAALAAAGADVDLLVQGDDGGSGSSNWVSQLWACGVRDNEVEGWSVHAYGNSPTTKLGRLISQTAAAGFSSSIGIYPTEYGISSTQNGSGQACQINSNNSGWGNQLTYSQAAADLNSGLDSIRSYLGNRLGAIYIYKARDDASACSSSNSEQYFGCLGVSSAEKGAYSAECRDQFTQ